MVTTIYIPVADTEKFKFDYGKKLSREEYDEMIYEHFKRTDKKVERYSRDMMNRVDNNNKFRGYSDYEMFDATEGDGYITKKCECNILDSKCNEIGIDFFIPYILNRKMFIVVLDINPEAGKEMIDGDIQSEMKYWMRDSDALLRDRDIEDKVKIKALPKTHFEVVLDEGLYSMTGCKLIEMYKQEGHPYKFAILVEKIISIKKHI